ncbi:unnamed protein product [Porites evermanni]|uniref:Uncharacterized protein n=1 Tax=Porites evermanni TaxID=104178 RepID=A0ABN8MKE0_9CNID|nr:unnamed protein product [Porites evermanni]
MADHNDTQVPPRYPGYPIQPYPQERPTSTSVTLQPNSTAQPPRPWNWLAVSIFTTLFCCLPCGVSAIVYSRKVDRAYNAGNHEEAEKNAKTAKSLNLLSVISGLIFIPLIVYLRVKAIQEQDNSF